MAFLLDKSKHEAPCPRCGFYNGFSLKQVRLNDVIICRGCNGNIQLVDYMNLCRNTVHRVEALIHEFGQSFSR